jgi:hypothetical protein
LNQEPFEIPNFKVQMSKECQIPKWDSEVEDPEMVSGQGLE